MITLKLPGEDIVEPMSLLGLVFIFNILYTYGWIREMFLRRSDKGRKTTFKLMIYLSLGLIFLSPVTNFIFLIKDIIIGGF